MISVIVPVFNEEKYIRQLLDFFLSAKPADKEIYLIDGGSTDQTVGIINEYSGSHSNIHLLHNPDKYVPYALNLALEKVKGSTVIRLDGHTKYAPDYFEKILETFASNDADIVGGPMRAIGDEPFQHAVAYATSTPFGIGDSKFHDETFEGYTDSVYLGAWKKEIFEVTGNFDERFLRNQDDEFHYRARTKGFKIYLNPEIRSWYYPRSTPKGLFRQYYQYGLYKPLVLKKNKEEIKYRHLIPAMFVLYLLSLPIALLFCWWLLPLALYISLALYFAAKNKEGLQVKASVVIIYPLLHLAYGIGFIRGLLFNSKL